jgi:ATP-dependent exoDNAse (exonuclease V) beta subunit
MSLVNTENECTKIIQQLLKEGELELEFSKEIESKIEGIFRLAEFQELFEGAEEVLNEQSIIMDELTTKRPDKIILKQNETILLDYKTGIPKEKDARQMREYISTLIEMELPAVKGFLFYTHTNELIAV